MYLPEQPLIQIQQSAQQSVRLQKQLMRGHQPDLSMSLENQDRFLYYKEQKFYPHSYQVQAIYKPFVQLRH